MDCGTARLVGNPGRLVGDVGRTYCDAGRWGGGFGKWDSRIVTQCGTEWTKGVSQMMAR